MPRLKLRSKEIDERRARPGRTRQDHKKRVLAVSDLREPSWPSGRQDLNLRPLDPQIRVHGPLTCVNRHVEHSSAHMTANQVRLPPLWEHLRSTPARLGAGLQHVATRTIQGSLRSVAVLRSSPTQTPGPRRTTNPEGSRPCCCDPHRARTPSAARRRCPRSPAKRGCDPCAPFDGFVRPNAEGSTRARPRANRWRGEQADDQEQHHHAIATRRTRHSAGLRKGRLSSAGGPLDGRARTPLLRHQ